ncbi:MAG: class III poly(R)-hydroxyalkanoic acid synthase subunit PhaE [Chloroflexales bacterium]|nr:class III poly(R)-hydroxyalkanoic acid synthase subunit PhaE [Chloroflexales bacterium]
MDSTDQARTLLDLWLDAQRQTWQNLYGKADDSAAPALPQLLAQWRQAAAQGFEAWAAGADPFAQIMSRQLISAQSTLLRILELITSAWQDLAPKVEAGDDRERALREAAEQIRRQLFPDPGRTMHTAQDVGDLWRIYLEELQQISGPWAELLRQAPGLPGGRPGPEGGAALMELTSLYWDAYERSFGRMLESPRMGFSRELEEKLLRGFDAWADFRRAGAAFQLVVADIWTGVFEQVLRELIERGQSGKPIQSLHDLLQRWTSVADRQLEVAFSSEPFLQAQRQMFNAAMRYRLHEQQIVEISLRTSYLPTRSEIDEVHRSLYELRKEVKALRKDLRQARSAPPGRAPARQKAVRE